MSGSEVEIIIVEDNPNDAELLMRVFKKHNVSNRIVHLKDGVEALDYLLPEPDSCSPRQATPRVVILDLKLPKINGIEVLRRMKLDDRMKNVPVVVLTSSREDRDLKDAYEAGVNSYVTKPIDFTEFARVVSELNMYWMLMNKTPSR